MGSCVLLLGVLGIIIQCIFIVIEHQKKYVPAVVLKGSASVIFCIIGYLGYSNTINTEFGKMVFIGLIMGAIGDILLNLRFVFEKVGQKIFLAGIAAFFTGHILYLVALIPLSTNLVPCLVVGVAVAATILSWIFKTLTVKLAFKLFGIFYIGAIVVMTSVAIGNVITIGSTNAIMYAIGAVLFTLSDIVLIFNTFGSVQKYSMRIINLLLYYVGQLLIACSLFFI